MKSGANFHDQNAIRKYHKEGYKVAEIASLTQIEPDVVAKFLPEKKAAVPKSVKKEA